MNIDNNKKIIIDILHKELNDRGVQNKNELITYLDTETDFFTAPSSTIFHGSTTGGLAQHSLNVYNILKEKVKKYKLEFKPSTIVICGLLHDICKTNFYTQRKKWRKEKSEWKEVLVWEVDDKFPCGHGEKSVILLQKFIKLIDKEVLAIRWHMMAYDPGIHFNYPSGFPFHKAVRENPLVTLLATSDLEATYLLEKPNVNENYVVK